MRPGFRKMHKTTRRRLKHTNVIKPPKTQMFFERCFRRPDTGSLRRPIEGVSRREGGSERSHWLLNAFTASSASLLIGRRQHHFPCSLQSLAPLGVDQTDALAWQERLASPSIPRKQRRWFYYSEGKPRTSRSGSF